MGTPETITTDSAEFRLLEAQLIPQVDKTELSKEIELGMVALSGEKSATEVLDDELAFLTSGIVEKPGRGRGDLRNSKSNRDEYVFVEKTERRENNFTRKAIPSKETLKKQEAERRSSAARLMTGRKLFKHLDNRNFS